MSEVYDIVRLAVAEEMAVSIDELSEDTKIIEDLGGDSLDQVLLALHIEEELGVSFPDSEFDRISTVKDLAEVVDRLLTNKKLHGK